MTTDPFIMALEGEQKEEECSLCVALAAMPEERAAATRRALSSKLGAARIARIFRQHGVGVGRPTILLHRREGHL